MDISENLILIHQMASFFSIFPVGVYSKVYILQKLSKFPQTPMGVLAHSLRTLDRSLVSS